MEGNLDDKREKAEVEAKFMCPNGVDWDVFPDVLHKLGFQYAREKPCFQVDAYFDTPQYTLLNSGAALRIRQMGEAYVGVYKVSEKQQGAIFERREFEWTLSDDETKLWNDERKPTIPPTIIEKLNLHGQGLRKVLAVETHRSTAVISGNDGFKAELSLDEVTFRGHKGQAHYREIEVELLNGRLEQLKQLADSLQNHLKLQPAVDSKYKKGMILVGKYGIPPMHQGRA